MVGGEVIPRFRGVSHQYSCFAALGAGTTLSSHAPTKRAAGAALIYTVGLVMLFGISGAYHRGQWTPRAKELMRRLDHATIFIFIAGSYTPFCLLAQGSASSALLALVWAGAGAGVLKTIFWIKCPRPITASLYVALGWVAVLFGEEAFKSLDPTVVMFITLGGIAYTIGAVVFTFRRPDPWPSIFGYHEVFHALVILAATLHFIAVTYLMRQEGQVRARESFEP